jgi:ArsR family transcriptional regulator
MRIDAALRAVANDRRRLILAWLKKPRSHFPRQVDGDLVADGVCGLFIARKLAITQASASVHLHILVDAGLLRGKKMKRWTFYKRDEHAIGRMKRMLDAIV